MNEDKGFTFIEVIAVIVLIGIISAVVIAKSFDFQDTAAEDAFLAKFKTHLKYARTNAMNSDENWGIGLTSSGYFLFSGTTSDKKLLPGEENAVVSFPESGNISISGESIMFDKFGQPSDLNGNLKQFDFSLKNDSVTVYKSGYIK
ncbi:MAG: Tfp pilus assembly protein FimT/FimU [Desulfobacteraceae bacterium]